MYNFLYMFSFRNISLSKQLGIFFGLVFLIPMIAVGCFLYLSVQNSIDQNKRELDYLATLQVGRVLSILTQENVAGQTLETNKAVLRDLQVFQSNFEQLSRTGQMRFFVIDADNDIRLISTSRFASEIHAPQNITSFIRTVLNSDQQIRVSVKDDRKQDAYLTVRYFKDHHVGFVLQKDKAEVIPLLTGFRDVFLASAGVVLILLILLIILAIQYFIDPLAEITQVAKRIEEGDYTQAAGVYGKNEIGIMAHAFNKMSLELIHTNRVLDQRVKEKTAKLQNALQIVHTQKVQDDALLSSIAEGMIATDQQGNILLVNRAAEFMFGFRSQDVLGKSIVSVLPLQTSKAESVADKQHPGALVLSTGQKMRTSDFLARGKDKVFPVELSAAPVLLKEVLIGSILILTDITKEKEIDRMKTEFIGIASHQLRGPLASLKWYGDWFAKGKAGKLLKTQKEFIDKMNASTITMISLVDDFLNVSRIEQGVIKNEPSKVVVEDLVNNILSISEHEMNEKKIHIQVIKENTHPALFVDPDMFREIIANFISNAIKYTPEHGSISICLSNNEKEFFIEVENTGYGIPDSEQRNIFSKFYRASNIVKQGLKGTGLGLYTTKCLAESMGGSVGFISVENQSTKFWAHLPLS